MCLFLKVNAGVALKEGTRSRRMERHPAALINVSSPVNFQAYFAAEKPKLILFISLQVRDLNEVPLWS